jgi:copper chaperone CopZ
MTCAYAVRGALQKFSGVEKVDVSLNKGMATVTLKPGNTVRLSDVWETVRKNGFTPKETKVVIRGEVVGGTNTELKVTGSNEAYRLLPAPRLRKRSMKYGGTPRRQSRLREHFSRQRTRKPLCRSWSPE